eukprot:TRINITY_DN11395_c0_g1_i1.p2 TRINITY_DN11395_c0_g1~~TRINITY_DN11395_c0_g1_i1.p2  ORF type:complete len:222 (-),score=80.61 TRINITY_DN11395_c0_g1_i1:283-948(-)
MGRTGKEKRATSKNAERPFSAAEAKRGMNQTSDKAAQLRPTINRMQEEINQLKEKLSEKTKMVLDLREKSSMTRCKRLEEELAAEKKKSEEYEQSHKTLQSIESAYNEYKEGKAQSESNSVTRDKGVILASIKATLSAWNSCPSYVKKHMAKQEEEIKALKEKLAATTKTKSVASNKSQIADKCELCKITIDKLKSEVEQLKGEKADLQVKLTKLKLSIKT